MTNDILKFKPFVAEVQKRLSAVHNVSGFIIGKNKISFEINNLPVTVIKDYDKHISKVIISCNDMFPCAISTNIVNKEVLLKEKDVVAAVNALDSYFMSLIGYDESNIICSRYNAVKYLMLPFFIYDYRKRKKITTVQDDLLYYLANKLNNNQWSDIYIYFFSGVNKKNGKEDCIFMFLVYINKVELYKFNCIGKKIVSDSGEFLAELPFDLYSNESGVSIIRSKLKNYTNFKLCDADIEFLSEEDYLNEH